MINFQNALKVASRFLGNDKINQAIELSKTVNSPQSAINALSRLGNPNQIIDDGLSKLNSPSAIKMASMFGASDKDLEDLRKQILGIKNYAPTTNTQPLTSNNKQQQNTSNSPSRLQDLINGLK